MMVRKKVRKWKKKRDERRRRWMMRDKKREVRQRLLA